MNWESICSKKAVAENAIQATAENLHQIQEELKGGVTMGAAKAIIRAVWNETPEAKKLIARLTVNFPKENSWVIGYAGLPQYAAMNIMGPAVDSCGYFLDIQEYINRAVGKILAKLNQFDINDDVALNTLNDFRKNVLTYIEGTRFNAFELSAAVDPSEAKWKDYTVASVAIDDGDYLMVTDFLPDLKEAHDKLLEQRNVDWYYEEDSVTIHGARYKTESCLRAINATHLFAEYLNELMAGIEMVLEEE